MTHKDQRKVRAALRAYDEAMRLVALAQTPEEVTTAQRAARKARTLWHRTMYGFRVWLSHPERKGKGPRQ